MWSERKREGDTMKDGERKRKKEREIKRKGERE